MGSDAFGTVDNLDAEVIFAGAVGLEVSGFLVAAAPPAGFLAAAAESGRLTSSTKREKTPIFQCVHHLN